MLYHMRPSVKCAWSRLWNSPGSCAKRSRTHTEGFTGMSSSMQVYIKVQMMKCLEIAYQTSHDEHVETSRKHLPMDTTFNMQDMGWVSMSALTDSQLICAFTLNSWGFRSVLLSKLWSALGLGCTFSGPFPLRNYPESINMYCRPVVSCC